MGRVGLPFGGSRAAKAANVHSGCSVADLDDSPTISKKGQGIDFSGHSDKMRLSNRGMNGAIGH